jgi:hypothetical protein
MEANMPEEPPNAQSEHPSAGGKQDMTRPELLDYVELKLWSGLVRRLLKWAGAVLVIYALAGTFGFMYYIHSQVDARIKNAEAVYAKKSATLLTYAKLQILLTEAYSTKKLELAREVVLALQGIDQTMAVVKDQRVRAQLDGAQYYLTQDVSWDEYASDEVSPKNLQAISLPRTDLYPIIRILPPREIKAEDTIGGKEISGVAMPHAVNDGTLRGVMLDVKFRIVELRAYRRAMQDVDRRIVEYGATTPSQELMNESEVATAASQEFDPAYKRYVAEASNRLLLGGEREIFAKYEYLYSIEKIVPPAVPTGVR